MVIIVGILFLLTSFALLNFLCAFRLERAPKSTFFPKVSLLVPLRNEEERIPSLLKKIEEIDYPQLEVIFLDDESNDNTWNLLQECSSPSIKKVKGEKLSLGWVGKPWACHQLARLASGEIFIFCDADVLMSPTSITHTVSYLENHRVDAVTVLPYQRMNSWFEKAIIPFVMHLPVMGLLPLRWMGQIHDSRVLVANGQWFAIRKEIYWKSGGHQACSNSVLEDMKLGKEIKKQGGKVLPVLSTYDIQVRMYETWSALEEGFTKNLFLLAGGNVRALLTLLTISVGIYLVPLVSLGSVWGKEAFCLLMGFRLLTAGAFRASLSSVLLHPVGALGFIYLLGRSGWAYTARTLTWKGRRISVS